MTTNTDLGTVEFSYLQKLLLDESAIVLEEGKEYLALTRLGSIVRKEGLGSVNELLGKLRSTPKGPLHELVVDAMTTNETSFFRDKHPFETLKTTIVPDLLATRPGKIRILCAACSTGQEPYTIAMLLREQFPLEAQAGRFEITAVDLSKTVLAQAESGNYSQLEVNRGLPVQLLVKYFTKDGRRWQLKDEIRSMVSFQTINLAGRWPNFPAMDIVFIRNVLIYFDAGTKRRILRKVREVMTPNGYMFLGGAETTLNLDDRFRRFPLTRGSYYRLAERSYGATKR